MNIWQDHNWGPMLLKEIDKPFNSKDYLFEIKFDGIRAIIFASPDKVVVQTRNKVDITNIYPELQAIKKLVKHATIFDGEIVAFQNNLPSFSKLQERSHLKNKDKIKKLSIENPICYVCFDILYDNKDITNMKLTERKKILSKIKENDVFIKNKAINNDGIKMFNEIKKIGLEGIVAKKKDSIYEINTRVDSWIKIKNFKDGIFYIGGYKENSSSPVISLALGEFINSNLIYVGNVVMAKKNPLYNKLKKLKLKKISSFYDYKDDNLNYINPIYKCEINYIERTPSNHLRQPVFKIEKD